MHSFEIPLNFFTLIKICVIFQPVNFSQALVSHKFSGKKCYLFIYGSRYPDLLGLSKRRKKKQEQKCLTT